MFVSPSVDGVQFSFESDIAIRCHRGAVTVTVAAQRGQHGRTGPQCQSVHPAGGGGDDARLTAALERLSLLSPSRVGWRASVTGQGRSGRREERATVICLASSAGGPVCVGRRVAAQQFPIVPASGYECECVAARVLFAAWEQWRRSRLAGEWPAFEREKTARRVLDAAVRAIPATERARKTTSERANNGRTGPWLCSWNRVEQCMCERVKQCKTKSALSSCLGFIVVEAGAWPWPGFGQKGCRYCNCLDAKGNACAWLCVS